MPPVGAAVLLARKEWRKPGVYNAEQFDPHPFLNIMPEMGLPWQVATVDRKKFIGSKVEGRSEKFE